LVRFTLSLEGQRAEDSIQPEIRQLTTNHGAKASTRTRSNIRRMRRKNTARGWPSCARARRWRWA
jgi:hypothetical protein